MSSLLSYGKVHEFEQAKLDTARKNRRRIAIISISTLVLVAIVLAAVLGSNANSDSASKNSKNENEGSYISALSVCNETLYKDTCYTTLKNAANSGHIGFHDIFKLSVEVALNELSKASKYFTTNNIVNNTMSERALHNCGELISLALDHLNSSLASSTSVVDAVDDLRTWLSSAGTYQQTCIDGLEGDKKLRDEVSLHLKNSTELTSNGLAIISWIGKVAESVKLRKRKLLSEMEWVRELKEQSLDSADFVVAKDGSGKYKSITAALKAVPDKSKKRVVIYVKKGVYYENVRVEKTKWNVTMIGDGMDKTIVSASLNFIDGTPTFSSATFGNSYNINRAFIFSFNEINYFLKLQTAAVFGQGFVARDMGFRNTAGPSKHQAVALMSTADRSVFYRCQMDAFQDTLYAHSNRQFYRECNIYGTVDFIFGNSAVVFQNCTILPKRPMTGQKNTITAQGRIDPNQNTGISIQSCGIWPYGDLSGVETYLGRPWKNYSTTVFMQSNMGGFIHPSGWLPWVGNSGPDTIFYTEFQNYGAGSSTRNRVKWKGVKYVDTKQASRFTVKPFLQGDKWIPNDVTYKSGL